MNVTKTINFKTQPFSPHFATPPVVETVLSVQFTRLAKWSAVHPGLYYETIRDRYPKCRHEAPLPPIIETFPPVPKAAQMQFSRRPELGRVLYTAEDDSSLVQVQPNRFGFNWKRADKGSDYPKFEVNGKLFLSELSNFDDFCDAEGIGRIAPTFCEVVYVNHIQPRDDETINDLFDDVFSGVSTSVDDSAILPPELITLNRTYQIGNQRGRLYAEIGVALETTAKPFLQFKLTSRLRHEDGGVAETLQEAHDWLNRAFLSLTNKQCRVQRWGQSDAE